MTLAEAEFLQFVDAHRVALTRVARAVCLSWADADDVTQEALVRVGLRWKRLAKQGEPIAYARTVVVRLAIDQARRRDREAVAVARLDSDPALHDRRWVDEAGWIRDALTALPPQQRAAIALRYLADRDDREIAEHLGCSESTVRSHISRGLDRIRASDVLRGSSDA